MNDSKNFPVVKPEKCEHNRGDNSTLQCVFTDPVENLGVRFWIVKCKVCNKYTKAYLTQEEAVARACLEWW